MPHRFVLWTIKVLRCSATGMDAWAEGTWVPAVVSFAAGLAESKSAMKSAPGACGGAGVEYNSAGSLRGNHGGEPKGVPLLGPAKHALGQKRLAAAHQEPHSTSDMEGHLLGGPATPPLSVS
jgi:hypothetical protein